MTAEHSHGDFFEHHGEFQNIFKDIDVQKCVLERNPLTNELGWRASDGYAFRITGKFEIDRHTSNIVYRYMPQPSLDLFREEYQDRLSEIKEQVGMNDSDALAYLLEEQEDYANEYTVPEEFVGKFLVLVPNIDGSKTLIGDDNVEQKVRVKQDVDAWYDTEYMEGINVEGGTEPNIFFHSTKGFVEWVQDYAEADPASCSIEMIRIEEKRKDLYTPPKEETVGIEFPFGSVGIEENE